jgi:hypothetical protein
LIIASIIVYQFYQQQTALIKLDKLITDNTPTETDNLIDSIDTLNNRLGID